MFGSNFVAFLTVQGFFIGIVFGILNSSSALSLLIDTLLISIFFYLFAHIIVALYFTTLQMTTNHFSKKMLELDLDRFVSEINKREKLIDNTTAASFFDNASSSGDKA